MHDSLRTNSALLARSSACMSGSGVYSLDPARSFHCYSVQAQADSSDATEVLSLVVPSFGGSTERPPNDLGSSHNVALSLSADVDAFWFTPVLAGVHNNVSWNEDEMAWLWNWTPTLSLRLSFYE